MGDWFTSLWQGIKDLWGGATASPDELHNIDDALGDDYNPVNDAANAAKDAAGDVGNALLKNTTGAGLGTWAIIIVGALFAMVILDN